MDHITKHSVLKYNRWFSFKDFLNNFWIIIFYLLKSGLNLVHECYIAYINIFHHSTVLF